MATQTKTTLPTAGTSTFNADLQAFLRQEDADRYDDLFISHVVSGGTHSTGASLTQTPASLTAYCGGYYVTETGSITYPDDATHIYVVAHKDTTSSVANWTRVTGTHYLFRSGTAAEPSLPNDSCWLMKVTTASGSVTAVEDRRFSYPYPLHVSTSAPTVTDDASKGFFVGFKWIDTTNDIAYSLLDSTNGAAVWTAEIQNAGLKNAIINGNFDIWQRGTSFTNSGYAADRWLVYVGGGATISRQSFTLGQTDVPNEPEFYLRHNRTGAAGAENVVLEQRIEDVRSFAGETVTFSFWAKAGSAKTFQADFLQDFGTGGSPSSDVTGARQAVSVTTSWQKFTFQFSIPSISGKTIGTDGDDSLTIRILESASFSTFTLDVAQVQVEKGSSATEFERRPIGAELELAQRYYAKTFPQGTAPAQSAGRPGAVESPQTVGASTAVVLAPVQFPVVMRATPTITFYNPQVANAQIRNVSASTDWSSSIAEQTSDRSFNPIGITPAGSSGDQTGSVHWTADADL